jgi:hypothetical protein
MTWVARTLLNLTLDVLFGRPEKIERTTPVPKGRA